MPSKSWKTNPVITNFLDLINTKILSNELRVRFNTLFLFLLMKSLFHSQNRHSANFSMNRGPLCNIITLICRSENMSCFKNTSVISRSRDDKYVKTYGDKVTILYIDLNLSRYCHVSTLLRSFRILLRLIVWTIWSVHLWPSLLGWVAVSEDRAGLRCVTVIEA